MYLAGIVNFFRVRFRSEFKFGLSCPPMCDGFSDSAKFLDYVGEFVPKLASLVFSPYKKYSKTVVLGVFNDFMAFLAAAQRRLDAEGSQGRLPF